MDLVDMNNQNELSYEDWRGRRADPRNQGGVRAAIFVCVVEVLENMVFLSNAINFVSYFLMSLHYSASKSANMVTNFMGTSFLLTIIGGFISDSFLSRFLTFILFCSLELLGIALLTLQAHNIQPSTQVEPSESQAALLYTGLYFIAIGVGGVKASLPAHGADQLDHNNQPLVSSFFNWFFFSLCTGGLIATTIMVWIQENHGWNTSFVISFLSLFLALIIFMIGFPFYRFKHPGGSTLNRIFNVIYSSIRNRNASLNALPERNRLHNKFRFLNKALFDDTVRGADVTETKVFLGLLPIFASTIMMSCCQAQLQTFTVHQGNIMNRNIHNFKIPTQSLSVIPITIMLVSIPLYEHMAQFFRNRISTQINIFRPLKRIGLGLALASISMVVAAVVENYRRVAATNHVTMSVFMLSGQYLMLGVSESLVLGGMLEFFYSEAPENMRSMCTALSWCSSSMGYFLSSVLVLITNSVTGHFGREWLGGNDLNHSRLDLFYALLSILNFLNFVNYIYWAKSYN